MNQDQHPVVTAATTSPAVLPVKAMTAFHIWRKDNEHHYRAANPWVGGTELSALLALGWRRLDATTKKVLALPPPARFAFVPVYSIIPLFINLSLTQSYEEQAEADQQRFDREWADYNARLQRMTHTEPTPKQH